MPVVLLHGWGLAQHTYREVIEQIAAHGCKVYAPAMPGFGGTGELPDESFSIGGYARWVADLIDAIELDEPAVVVGTPSVAVSRSGTRTITRRGALARPRQLDRRLVLEAGKSLALHRRAAVNGDYDGDHRTDYAVYRPVDGPVVHPAVVERRGARRAGASAAISRCPATTTATAGPTSPSGARRPASGS